MEYEYDEGETALTTALDELNDLIERDAQDSAIVAAQKVLLQTTLHNLSLVDTYIKSSKGSRGVNSFTMLLTSFRELVADIQALKDRAGLGESICASSIKPHVQALALDFVTEYAALQADAEQYIRREEDRKAYKRILVNSRTRLSEKVSQAYENMQKDIVTNLSR